MQRVREKLVAGLAWLFTRLALLVAPRPPAPPEYSWRVTVDDFAQGKFQVLFLRGAVSAQEWHIAVVCEFANHEPVMVDSGVGRCWITPMKSHQVERVVRALRPDYCVTVWSNYEGWAEHVTIGPVTCVTLAKRLLGVHNPGVVTSRQMLDVLWRYRDGSS